MRTLNCWRENKMTFMEDHIWGNDNYEVKEVE